MSDYTERQREEYWQAVNILRQLVSEGISVEDLLEEIEEDI